MSLTKESWPHSYDTMNNAGPNCFWFWMFSDKHCRGEKCLDESQHAFSYLSWRWSLFHKFCTCTGILLHSDLHSHTSQSESHTGCWGLKKANIKKGKAFLKRDLWNKSLWNHILFWSLGIHIGGLDYQHCKRCIMNTRVSN